MRNSGVVSSFPAGSMAKRTYFSMFGLVRGRTTSKKCKRIAFKLKIGITPRSSKTRQQSRQNRKPVPQLAIKLAGRLGEEKLPKQFEAERIFYWNKQQFQICWQLAGVSVRVENIFYNVSVGRRCDDSRKIHYNLKQGCLWVSILNLWQLHVWVSTVKSNNSKVTTNRRRQRLSPSGQCSVSIEEWLITRGATAAEVPRCQQPCTILTAVLAGSSDRSVALVVGADQIGEFLLGFVYCGCLDNHWQPMVQTEFVPKFVVNLYGFARICTVLFPWVALKKL